MNIILIGHGKMGKMILDTINRQGAGQVLGVVDPELFASPMDVPGRADVVMDFSYPGNLDAVLEYAEHTGCALVIGTTGYSTEQLEKIHGISQKCPVVHASNYSLGVAVLRRALQAVAPMLMPEFDVEIVETHHNQKADAPSGTAKLLLKTVDPNNKYEHVFGREGITGKRKKEIGVHALRGGTVAGEHSVFFFGEDETLEFKHSASSRQIFVNGAICAAQFVCGREPGLYSIDDVIKKRE